MSARHKESESTARNVKYRLVDKRLLTLFNIYAILNLDNLRVNLTLKHPSLAPGCFVFITLYVKLFSVEPLTGPPQGADSEVVARN